MLAMYAVGILINFDFNLNPFLNILSSSSTFPQYINEHFIVSVAVSGSLSPWMYISLKRTYEEPMRIPIETLSSIQVASVPVTEVHSVRKFAFDRTILIFNLTRNRRPRRERMKRSGCGSHGIEQDEGVR